MGKKYSINKPTMERIYLKDYGHIPANLDYKSESMVKKMLDNCNVFHNYDAIKYEQGGITHLEKFDEFASNIELIAKMIKENGVKQGDRVIVLLPYLPEAYASIYGVIAPGAVFVPLHPNETKSHRRMEEIIREVKPSLIFCLDSCVQDLDQIITENRDLDEMINRVVYTTPVNGIKKSGIMGIINPIIDKKYQKSGKAPESVATVSDKFYEFRKAIKSAKHYRGEYMANIKSSDDAVYLYSSGSSGRKPDLIPHDHDAFNSLADTGYHICDCIEPGQKLIAVPGLFHGFGLGTATHTLLNQGVTQLVLPNPKDLDAYADLQRRENADIHISVPRMLESQRKSGKFDDISYSNTKLFICGGGAAREDTIEYWNNKLPEGAQSRIGYGSTQMIGGTCINLRHKQKPNSIGIPLPDYYYKLYDTETGEPITEPNKTGEAHVSGPSVMKKTVNNANPNSLYFDNEGVRWYKTSDLLMRDEEGWYSFIDRADDIINMDNGNLVNPYVKDQILKKFGIGDDNALIFNIQVQNGKGFYEKLVAIVEYVADKDIADSLKKALKTEFEKYLKSYEIPDEIIIVDSFPLSLNGKAKKADIRQAYKKGDFQFKLEMKK